MLQAIFPQIKGSNIIDQHELIYYIKCFGFSDVISNINLYEP